MSELKLRVKLLRAGLTPLGRQAWFGIEQDFEQGFAVLRVEACKIGASILQSEHLVKPVVDVLASGRGQGVPVFGVDEIAARITKDARMQVEVAK